MQIRRRFGAFAASCLFTLLLAQITAFGGQAKNASVVSERLAQGTPSSLEVPPGGKPSQEIGNLMRVELDSFQILADGEEPLPNCDPSYPTVCIPSYPPDLDCDEIPYRNFQVSDPDPHGFDADHDGVGCESWPPRDVRAVPTR